MTNGNFALRIHFSGLCAFVPSEKVEPGTKSVSEMHVLLVNARDDVKSNLMFDEVNDLSDHFAFLVFNIENIQGVPRLPVGPKGVWQLLAEEISVLPTFADPVRLKRTGASLPEPAKIEHENDFLWIPDIKNVLEGAERIDEELIHPESGEDRITACVHLKGGELAVSDLGVASGGKFNLHRFVPPKDSDYPLEQVLPSEVVWELTGLTGNVTLRLKKFGDDDSVRELVLSPVLDPQGNSLDIEVKIVDLCVPSLFHRDYVGLLTESSGMPRGDVDFKWFYLLSDSGGESFPALPVPVRFPADRGAGGGEPQICTGCLTHPPQPPQPQ